MKRFLSLVLVFALLVCGMPISASATTIGQQDPDSGISRYTVLVLDTSGTTIFLGPGGEAYTVDAALEYAQKAASCFLSDIRKSSDENLVQMQLKKDGENIGIIMAII